MLAVCSDRCPTVPPRAPTNETLPHLSVRRPALLVCGQTLPSWSGRHLVTGRVSLAPLGFHSFGCPQRDTALFQPLFASTTEILRGALAVALATSELCVSEHGHGRSCSTTTWSSWPPARKAVEHGGHKTKQHFQVGRRRLRRLGQWRRHWPKLRLERDDTSRTSWLS